MELITIEERKKHLLTVTKHIDGKPYSWNELSVAVEGKYTNLRVWIGNEKSIADGCGRQMIYMRLDCYQQYSVPLTKESYSYIKKPHSALLKLLEFYVFGETDVTRLDDVLRCIEKLKERQVLSW